MGKLECISRLEIFRELSDSELRDVASFSTKENLLPGEFLFRDREPVESIYIVTEGRLKLSKLSEEGKELILGFAGSDSVFGEEALFSDEQYSMDAEAMEDSCVTSCSKSEMERLLLENPRIAMKVIRSLSRKLSQSTAQVSELAFRNVRERLLNTLWRLAESYGHRTGEGWEIDLKLTHSDLAGIINASRVTVTQTLSRLREEGLVAMNDRKIMLKKTG